MLCRNRIPVEADLADSEAGVKLQGINGMEGMPLKFRKIGPEHLSLAADESDHAAGLAGDAVMQVNPAPHSNCSLSGHGDDHAHLPYRRMDCMENQERDWLSAAHCGDYSTFRRRVTFMLTTPSQLRYNVTHRDWRARRLDLRVPRLRPCLAQGWGCTAGPVLEVPAPELAYGRGARGNGAEGAKRGHRPPDTRVCLRGFPLPGL